MIRIVLGDITKVKCNAIVNPANSGCSMGGGVAYAIKRRGGDIIEQEAMKKAPVKVGTAIQTKAGKLPCRYVIHSPTMENPAEKANADNVRKATRAALILAKKLRLQSIAFPGMGTGTGGMNYMEAAKSMAEAIGKFKFNDIILVARNIEMMNAFEAAINV